jgi:hypothetical protein
VGTKNIVVYDDDDDDDDDDDVFIASDANFSPILFYHIWLIPRTLFLRYNTFVFDKEI